MFQVETISAKMLDYYVDRMDSLIIDLRSEENYQKSHIKGAVSCPYDESEEPDNCLMGSFPQGKLLVFYGARGGASMKAAKRLAKRGYRTRSVIGGFQAYRGRNLVISKQV